MITQPALHATGRPRVTLCDVPTLPPAHLARDNGTDCPEASIERTPVADHEFGFRTQALHAGAVPDAVHGSRAVPIHQTSSFVFESAEDAANLFALQKYGNIYSRIGNPTVAAFEERVATLEGGIGAVATASGMAAEFVTFAALAGAGDHIVASSKLYGGTITQLDVSLRRFGVETTFVDSAEAADFEAAIQDNTKAVYTEIVANPSGDVVDLPGLADVAHRHGVPLVVDATLTPPYLIRPIEHGADIVIHSATKFLGGQGTTLGGVVVESGRFPWDNGKFPSMTEPVPSYGGVSWWGNFGEYGFLTKLRSEQLRDFGPSLAPQSAFQLMIGIETLAQRMDAHLANAQRVAEWLDADERLSETVCQDVRRQLADHEADGKTVAQFITESGAARRVGDEHDRVRSDEVEHRHHGLVGQVDPVGDELERHLATGRRREEDGHRPGIAVAPGRHRVEQVGEAGHACIQRRPARGGRAPRRGPDAGQPAAAGGG